MSEEAERFTLPSSVKPWQLWFSLAAGPLIWALHLMIVYPLTSLTCERGLLDVSTLRVIQVVVTAVSILPILYAGYLSVRNWQVLPAEGREPGESRYVFMVFLALLLNFIFLITIIISLVPIFGLAACGQPAL